MSRDLRIPILAAFIVAVSIVAATALLSFVDNEERADIEEAGLAPAVRSHAGLVRAVDCMAQVVCFRFYTSDGVDCMPLSQTGLECAEDGLPSPRFR